MTFTSTSGQVGQPVVSFSLNGVPAVAAASLPVVPTLRLCLVESVNTNDEPDRFAVQSAAFAGSAAATTSDGRLDLTNLWCASHNR